MAVRPYNYPAAFVEFARGSPLPEIAEVLGIPEATLREHAKQERWASLVKSLPAEPVAVGGPAGVANLRRSEAQERLIEENRAENLRLWTRLRGDAARLVEELCEGTLRFERYWHNRGEIVAHRCEPTPADRTALANYLQMACLGTYQASGDRSAAVGSKDDALPRASQAPAITIVLPGAVSLPRGQRGSLDSGVVPATCIEVQGSPNGNGDGG